MEAGKESGRVEGLFWSDSPSVGKLVHKIIDEHKYKVSSGAQEKGGFAYRLQNCRLNVSHFY